MKKQLLIALAILSTGLCHAVDLDTSKITCGDNTIKSGLTVSELKDAGCKKVKGKGSNIVFFDDTSSQLIECANDSKKLDVNSCKPEKSSI